MQSVIKSAAATHGKTSHGAKTFVSFYSIGLFNEGHELLKKEIFILPLSIRCVRIPPCTGICIRHYDDHWRGNTVSDGFVCYMLNFAKLDPSGLIIAAAMQQVEH